MKIRPIITEKSNKNVEDSNTYMFGVTGNIKASKLDIARLIEQEYDVEVVKINSSRRLGKLKRAGRKRTLYAQPETKFFYVKLKEGQVIPDFNITEE